MLNPIEKHKSEIEKRISQLESKFREKHEANELGRRAREGDENRQQTHLASRTVEMRARPKAAGEIARVKREVQREGVRVGYSPLSELHQTSQVVGVREEKDEQIKELYDMMKSILEGQKNIEKEISEMKREQLKESVKQPKNQDYTAYSYAQEKAAPIFDSRERSQSHVVDPILQAVQTPPEHSYPLDKAQNRDKIASKPVSISKTACLKPKKREDFESVLQQLKSHNRQNSRFCIQQQAKAKIWSEVESRVRDSQREYKDTMHRNNKHELQHLMSTYELQRKLKDDLVERVFQQCNNQIYK